jgi:hypothetical protein
VFDDIDVRFSVTHGALHLEFTYNVSVVLFLSVVIFLALFHFRFFIQNQYLPVTITQNVQNVKE